MRQSSLQALYDSVKDRIGIGIEQFSQALEGWEVLPLECGGEVVGGFAVKGNEVHVGYSKAPRSSIIKHIKTVFQPVMERCGTLTTTVLETNERGLKFCRRMGFVEIERKGGMVYMRCERLNYV